MQGGVAERLGNGLQIRVTRFDSGRHLFFEPPHGMDSVSMENWISVIGGLILLLLGAEILVRGAVSLAMRLRISPTTAGLTIVALGTSLPELMITVQDQWSGTGNLAIGGIVGSNIFNLGAILGLSAVIFPVDIKSRTLKLEHPFMILVTLVLAGMAGNGVIAPREGWILLGLCALFVGALMFRVGDPSAKRLARQVTDVVEEFQPAHRPLHLDVLFVVGGVTCLHYGGVLCVEGARGLALAWGWSEHLIGLTIVALGTSAPELAVSILAALRKRTEIAIGNIVGSCIYNITFVLGVGSAMGHLAISEQVAKRDIPVLIVLSVLMLPLMIRGRSLGRGDGVLLIVGFLAYYGWVLSV